jgi:glucosamine--fructose-6-phosphate aminotransferase (isomerizing)
MCGIFAYSGNRQDADAILLHGLERLEYRGYDSAGIAVGNDGTGVTLFKSVGKVSSLAAKVESDRPKDARFTFGIAHTRWATHGGVTIENTHPHSDAMGKLFLVHNGIVENSEELAGALRTDGVKFYGQTDSEIVAKLVGKEMETAVARSGHPLENRKTGDGFLADPDRSPFLRAVETVLPKLEGAYALLLMHADAPGELIGVKYGSPLVFGRNPKTKECFFASDVAALAGYAEEVVFLDDGDIVHVLPSGEYSIRSEGSLVSRPFERVQVEGLKAEKNGFEHFMLKEIFEQPKVANAMFQGRVDFKDLVLNAAAFQDLRDTEIDRIAFIACGTSYHAGWAGSYFFREIAGMPATAEIASEFLNSPVTIDPKTLYVFVSQSGETADAIEPLKFIKAHGGKTFGIVNVVGSTISRLTDFGLFTRAGTEVGVASTKAFTAQLSAVLLLALFYAIKHGADFRKYRSALEELADLPAAMKKTLELSAEITKIAATLSKFPHLFFLGRGDMLPIAAESALKFKEITYLHAHAMPLGELKHGTLALIDENCPSVVFIPNDALFHQNKSSVSEIRARNGKVLAISERPISEADWNLVLGECGETLFPFCATIAGQLLAYHAARTLGREIDRPRNLAKSVTVK